MRKTLLFVAAIAFAFGAFLASCATQAQTVSKSVTVSSNQATLKSLPITAFAGLHSEMARNGGAKPDLPCTTATT